MDVDEDFSRDDETCEDCAYEDHQHSFNCQMQWGEFEPVPRYEDGRWAMR